MVIEKLSSKTFVEWDDYVEEHPDSTCYHLRAWQTVAERAYRIAAHFLIARKEPGRPICGALPLFIVGGPFRSHVTNGLFGAYGAILADDAESRVSLAREARRIFERAGADHLMLKCLNEEPLPPSLGLERQDSWVIARLRLEESPERMWLSFRDKIRNCVRKAQKHGLELRRGESQLEAFYDVLSENMHQKGAPIYGLGFMRELVRAMGYRADVLTLWYEGKAVAGALVIDHSGTIYVPFASSRPTALAMCPNNLLYWEIIRRGCSRKMHTLDFGRSLRESGTLAFKLSWGAEVREQPSFVASARGKDLRIDPTDRRIDFFVRSWKRLPRPVVNAVGPAVCRSLAGLI